MSRKPKFEPHVVESAKVQVSEAKTVAEMRAAQAVLLPALCGLSRDETGACLGLSSSRVGQLQAQARNPDLKPKNTHGGRRRERMTIEEEKAFLEPWEHEAKTAGVIVVPPIHQALEKKLPEVVAEALKSPQAEGKMPRLMFQDEARFGRMSRPRRCWAPPGTRPVMQNGYEREFTYVYGAVSPMEGAFDHMICEKMNTEEMGRFLPNRVYSSMEAVRSQLTTGLRNFAAIPSKVTFLTAWHWIRKALA